MTTVMSSTTTPESSYLEETKLPKNLEAHQQYMLTPYEQKPHLHHHHHHYHHHHLHSHHHHNPRQSQKHTHCTLNHNEEERQQHFAYTHPEPNYELTSIKHDHLENSIDNNHLYEDHGEDDGDDFQKQKQKHNVDAKSKESIVDTHLKRHMREAFLRKYQLETRNLRTSTFHRQHNNHHGKEFEDQTDSLKAEPNHNSYYKPIKILRHDALRAKNVEQRIFWKLPQSSHKVKQGHPQGNRNRKEYDDVYDHPENDRYLDAYNKPKKDMEKNDTDHEDDYSENTEEDGFDYNYDMDREVENDNDFQYTFHNSAINEEEDSGSGYEGNSHHDLRHTVKDVPEQMMAADYINDENDDWNAEEEAEAAEAAEDIGNRVYHHQRDHNSLSDRSYTRIIRSRLHVSL